VGQGRPEYASPCESSLIALNLECGDLKRRKKMLWTILVVLLVLWLLGFIGHVGGNLIHILLVVAVIVLIYNVVIGRRAV